MLEQANDLLRTVRKRHMPEFVVVALILALGAVLILMIVQ